MDKEAQINTPAAHEQPGQQEQLSSPTTSELSEQEKITLRLILGLGKPEPVYKVREIIRALEMAGYPGYSEGDIENFYESARKKLNGEVPENL